MKRPLILCCDDDDLTLLFLKSVLKHQNTVICIEDSSKLYDSVIKYSPDLILLDINMPKPDGLELLQILKNDPATNNIPVVMFTSDGKLETVKKVKSLGSDGYILKPLQKDAFLKRFNDFLLKFGILSNLSNKIKQQQPDSIIDSYNKNIKNDMSEDNKDSNEKKYIQPAAVLSPSEKPIYTRQEVTDSIQLFKEIKINFQKEETLSKSIQLIVNESIRITDSEKAAFFLKNLKDNKYDLTYTENIFEEDMIDLYKKHSKDLTRIFSLGTRNRYLLNDTETNTTWNIRSLRSGSNNLIGLIFLKPKKDTKLTLKQGLKIEFFLQIISFILDAESQKKGAENSLKGIALAFANSLDAKDKYTQGHTERVTMYSLAISTMANIHLKEYYINPKKLQLAGLLHDIGKIGIPDSILGKSTQLNKEEFEIMKTHVTIGRKMLQNIPELQIALDGTLHHERYDGKGYPFGLVGEDIPVVARIINVADTFDAMTTDRPYRKGLEPQTALNEIRKNAGTQFDPLVVELFERAYTDELLIPIMDYRDKTVQDSKILVDKEYQDSRDYNVCETLFSKLDKVSFGSPRRHQLISIIEDPNLSITTISEELESDQAVSAKILKLANSAFYGFLSTIDSVKQGIIILGLAEIKNMLYFLNLHDMFKTSKKYMQEVDSLWKHSLIVGLIARYLSEKYELKKIMRQAFLSAIMHDFGKIIMLSLYPERYHKVYKNVIENSITFKEAEEKEFSISHDKVGKYVSVKWNLPVEIGNNIMNHHNDNVNFSEEKICSILRLSNDLYYRTSVSEFKNYPHLNVVEDAAYNIFGINNSNIEDIIIEIEEMIKKSEEDLNKIDSF